MKFDIKIKFKQLLISTAIISFTAILASCATSNTEKTSDANPWYQIDLGKVQDIKRSHIHLAEYESVFQYPPKLSVEHLYDN